MTYIKKLALGLAITFFATTGHTTVKDFSEFLKVGSTFLKVSSTPRFAAGKNIGGNASYIEHRFVELSEEAQAYDKHQKHLASILINKYKTERERDLFFAKTDAEKEYVATVYTINEAFHLKGYWTIKQQMQEPIIFLAMAHPEMHELYEDDATNVKSFLDLYNSVLDKQDQAFEEEVLKVYDKYGADEKRYYHKDRPYSFYEVCGTFYLNNYLKARIALNSTFLEAAAPILKGTKE